MPGVSLVTKTMSKFAVTALPDLRTQTYDAHHLGSHGTAHLDEKTAMSSPCRCAVATTVR